MLNLAASIIYLCVALMCGLAAIAAGRAGSRHKAFWTFAAVFFLCLIFSRQLAIEDHVRDMLRSALKSDGIYEDRRSFQRPVAGALLVALFLAMGLVWRFRPTRGLVPPPQAVRWAIMGLVLMTGLILARIASFHQLDALLYRGPRFNWLADIGSSALVAWSAWRFATTAGRQRRRSPPI